MPTNNITNVYEKVLASAARAREIRETRYGHLNSGRYEPGQFKKMATPADQAIAEIDQGKIGREYLIKSVNKPTKRREHIKDKFR